MNKQLKDGREYSVSDTTALELYSPNQEAPKPSLKSPNPSTREI